MNKYNPGTNPLVGSLLGLAIFGIGAAIMKYTPFEVLMDIIFWTVITLVVVYPFLYWLLTSVSNDISTDNSKEDRIYTGPKGGMYRMSDNGRSKVYITRS